MKVIYIYLIIINVITFAAYAIDKCKAVHGKWRIKEATLLFLAFIGGSVGGLISMYLFRHKIRKWYFKYTLPVMLILHIVLLFAAGKWLA